MTHFIFFVVKYSKSTLGKEKQHLDNNDRNENKSFEKKILMTRPTITHIKYFIYYKTRIFTFLNSFLKIKYYIMYKNKEVIKQD